MGGSERAWAGANERMGGANEVDQFFSLEISA